MSERVFIDTNVFVYADDPNPKSGAKRERARAVLSPLISSRRAVVSTQILQEYFNAATKKLAKSAERARWRVEAMARLEVVVIRPELVLAAIDLHRLHSLSLWDALVIASAAAGNCARLLTEDLQHGQTISGVLIENPFSTSSRASEPRARYSTRSSARL
ncbi:MAG TPA: PIN domain-containing protein [Kofleriaceae bacterium]|nr:PIN domain-containing protein [Kofleriaceae bacterium]